ncbi:hypothetical protein L596_015113 [Steinernema carpocapsae]|uniref:Uncharacterized protein n=1 Tax=Steinernema carpocapsae TaxID=34508 RepID=A0A4U5NE07_STECR|nr:hypothetical protein L596_015113 [Steinernema carpocapsae]
MLHADDLSPHRTSHLDSFAAGKGAVCREEPHFVRSKLVEERRFVVPIGAESTGRENHRFPSDLVQAAVFLLDSDSGDVFVPSDQTQHFGVHQDLHEFRTFFDFFENIR